MNGFPPIGSPKIVLEVCTSSLQGALDSELAGADRIELNSALELEGLTPSAGLMNLVSTAIRIPIIAMARPRAGDFQYSESEWDTLMADVSWLLKNGADGIAFGCLDSKRAIDLQRCREMRALAGTNELVFHKAFDDVRDWSAGLEILIESGINRVMTSGQQPTAEAGLATISKIVAQARGRIEVLPAGRIDSKNAGKILRQSGCHQLHGSFSSSPDGDIPAEIRRTIRESASLGSPS